MFTLDDDLIIRLLAHHATRLTAGDDVTDALSARYSAYPDVAGLLFLARRLSEALTPVAPSTPFVRTLEEQLRKPDAEPRPSLLWMILATTGSLLSLAGVTLLWHRRWRALWRSRTAVP